ncbi:MAG: hypothetical protein K2K74_09690 [Lachnospiraceae bacterium]|nr:hypothetical protein [Lachnospiraceae bacterium]
MLREELREEKRKGNDSMKLYLSVDTDIEDRGIDYIEVNLVTGEPTKG